jgi:putative ABC transport system permease protein
VDPATYPFYGRLGLRSGAALRLVLDGSSAIVSADLLDALGVHLGDSIRIGDASFQVRDVMTSEPDRALPAQMQEPRILISQEGLDRTGRLKFGDSAYYRLLIQIDPAAGRGTLLSKLENLFPQAEVVDYTVPTPQMTAAIEGLIPFLDLLGLLTLLCGCVAIATAVYFHLLHRMDTIAILKALGATGTQVMAIYWFQVLVLSLAGIALGISTGRLLERGAVAILARILDSYILARSDLSIAAETAGLSLLAAATAIWVPLMRIRGIPALRLQRRDMGEKEDMGPMQLRQTTRRAATCAVVIAIVGLIFLLIVPARRAAAYFVIGSCGGVAILYLLGYAAIGSLRWSIRRGARQLPWPIRQGGSNLYRYRRRSSLVIVAFATGMALIVVAATGQQQFGRHIIDTIPVRVPNLIIVNISEAQRAELSRFLLQQPGLSGPPSFAPTSALTLVRAGALTLTELRARHNSWIQRIWQATCFSHDPGGIRIVSGRWWDAISRKNDVALDADIAKFLGVQVGSELEFLTEGRPLRLRVAALIRVPPAEQVWGNGILINCGVIKPAAYNGALAVTAPDQLPSLERALHRHFPQVTIMAVKEFVDRIERLGADAARVLRIIAGLVVCTAIVLLISVIYSLRTFRVREIAILRAIGARSTTLLAVLATEYLAVAMIASLVGALVGCTIVTLVSWEITGKWSVSFAFGQVALLAGGAAVLAAAVGVGVSSPLLRTRPLEILRRP